LIKMSLDSDQAVPPTRRKCANCGLVNAAADEVCRRCGAQLTDDEAAYQIDSAATVEEETPPRRSLSKRVVWIVSTTVIVLVLFYLSLLVSSSGLDPDQRSKVDAAIGLLEQKGFSREAWTLKHLAVFRGTDNWFNSYVGHRDAFAATNFPFEIVTVYPEFFKVPVDDCERAAVLIHEARHLQGDGEEAALKYTWQNKQRLGWTADKYSWTKVWNDTERFTKAQFGYMFQCGLDNKSDCY
jgi:hypothetical protein